MILISSLWFRPTLFLALITVLGLIEIIAPRRILNYSKRARWAANLSLTFFNVVVLRILIPFTLVAIAFKARFWGVGLFNYVSIPQAIEVISSLIIFDFFIYLQHVATHKFALLWRFHQVHHADLDLDVSSGTRFHTFEIILSLFFKAVLIFLIGPSPLSVILFEVILNSMAMFNHSNINIPMKLDQYLRLIIVTPDMHRIHHSTDRKEHNRNFGFNLSIWDFLFNSYQEKPRLGQLNMNIGLDFIRDPKYINIFKLLKLPFLK